MSTATNYLGELLTPDLDPAYVGALLGPLGETVAIAWAAMAVVILLSLPLAVSAELNWPGARPIVAGLAVFRSLPDLTLAILCVIMFGIGPGAGLIALIVYYTSAVSKIFADLLETTPRAPLEALSSTGASQFQTSIYGLLPLARDDLHNYGAIAFECALRSSIIVGAVGGGGIGTELVGSLAQFDFHRASTQILLLVILVALLDRLANFLRGHAGVLALLLVPGLGLAAWYAPHFFAFEHALSVVGRMVPPSLSADSLVEVPWLVAETVGMALAGTLAAAAVSTLVAYPASRRHAPAWLAFAMRRLLEFLRTIPEVVWGLLIVSIAGVGATAGALALALHSAGTLGRLFADTLDTAPIEPHEALVTTGARPLSVALFAGAPLSFKQAATHVLFRFDWNLRMATVLGLIGAGGVGQALYLAQQLFFYREVLAYLLITIALILATERLSRAVRSRIGADSVFSRGRVCASSSFTCTDPVALPSFRSNPLQEHVT